VLGDVLGEVLGHVGLDDVTVSDEGSVAALDGSFDAAVLTAPAPSVRADLVIELRDDDKSEVHLDGASEAVSVNTPHELLDVLDRFCAAATKRLLPSDATRVADGDTR
jgi:hypothetical protein